ncbi:hypothetical protein [Enterobacter sp. R4-368]|uniref:hypothetical protein n=1 Tax=Enterobacter sp. R4-368 TaxID=1166130 RepID=UPI0003A4E45B|nr:hypothetical protein [Enterobacter sp. R4-368]
MLKTCIICGKAAGSGEHVFPAALGGRRVNRGIYCSSHDNSYSDLVSEIAGQLDFINAYLGVKPDHSKRPKAAYAVHSLTGETVSFTSEDVRFTEPRIISRRHAGEYEETLMVFPDRQSAKRYITEQEASGCQFQPLSRPTEIPYIIDELSHHRSFGGACGLGAIAYIAQTYFAQEFPDIARTKSLSDFIHYTQAIARIATLGGGEPQPNESEKLIQARHDLDAALKAFEGKEPVWWDFTPTADDRPNHFEFGHRVTVGVDSTDGQIYGRVSLFSVLMFSVCFGTAPKGSLTQEVSFDINPLAEHTPHDCVKSIVYSASGRVFVPDNPTEKLEEAISSGKQKLLFDNLFQRLEEHQLRKLSRSINADLARCSTMSKFEARNLIDEVLSRQKQAIWRLVISVIGGLKTKMVNDGQESIAPLLDQMIASDVHSASGLTPLAEAFLSLAHAALLTQMEQDSAAGVLNEERIAELMGKGPGLYVVGKMVLSPLIQVLGEHDSSGNLRG